MKYSQDDIKKLIDGIYSGEITEYDIPTNLYFATAEYLRTALYQGFGGTLNDFIGKDLELLTTLRENVYMFSAAKTFQEIKEIRSLMFNEDGELRTNREFNKLAEQEFETWNEAYGLTEYNTAVAQATMAGKWNEIEKNKDLLPYLRYSTIGDACEICAPLDGLTAPVDDPIWNVITPSNHFNCECLLEQHEADADVTPISERDAIFDNVSSKMDDVFKMNPGKDGYIFKGDHPYFDVSKNDRKFAKENFGLPIPENDNHDTD